MKVRYFSLILLVSGAFFSLPALSRSERMVAPPRQSLVHGSVEESPYAKPYLSENYEVNNVLIGNCNPEGLPDRRSDGTCYDVNGGEQRLRMTVATGRGAVESIFKKNPDGRLVLWARFDRKNELNQNALIPGSEHPDARAYRLAKNGRPASGAVADKSTPPASQPQGTSPGDVAKSAAESAAGRALGVMPKIFGR